MGASVVSRGDSSPVLDFGEHVLDFVALFVEDGVIGNECLAVFLGRDARRNAALF